MPIIIWGYWLLVLAIDESVPYFKTALEASPNVEQFWLSYIDTLIKLGHLDGANKLFSIPWSWSEGC